MEKSLSARGKFTKLTFLLSCECMSHACMHRKKCTTTFNFLEQKATTFYLIVKKDKESPLLLKIAHIKNEGGVGIFSYFTLFSSVWFQIFCS